MKTLRERLLFAAAHSEDQVIQELHTSESGMSEWLVQEAREIYGSNIVTHGRKETLLMRICHAFVNPFTAILFVLVFASAMADIVFAAPGEENYVTVVIITAMVMISGILRFVQETRSGNAAAKLSNMIHTTTCAERMGQGKREIPLEDVVVGDMVYLSAGDMIPADVRILFAKDLFVSQSALTGESEPVDQNSVCSKPRVCTCDAADVYWNCCFDGDPVHSPWNDSWAGSTAPGLLCVAGGDNYLLYGFGNCDEKFVREEVWGIIVKGTQLLQIGLHS